MSDKKVMCYVTREGQAGKEVLVFRLPENRRAGVQVPFADLKTGADGETVAKDWLQKSTELHDLKFIGGIGNTYYYDLDDDVSYQRFFFHFKSDCEKEEWETKIDGVDYQFFWVPVMDASKKIYWNQAKLLNRVLD